MLLIGYIVIQPQNEPSEILIMDTPDPKTAQKVWRWNLGGLGYSDKGVDGPYDAAITMDGAIVADFITTGKLNANLIKTGMLQSNNYKQGVSGTRINMDTGEIDTPKFKVSDAGEITATGGIIGGFTLSQNTLSANLTFNRKYTSTDVERIRKIIMGEIKPTTADYEKYDLTKSGIINSGDYMAIKKMADGIETGNGKLIITTNTSNDAIRFLDADGKDVINLGRFGGFIQTLTVNNLDVDSLDIRNYISVSHKNDSQGIYIGTMDIDNSDTTYIALDDNNELTAISLCGYNGSIEAKAFNNISLEERKKNITIFDKNAIDIIKNSDIYEYNYKTEKDTDKKHVGFIIGPKYRTPKEAISADGESIDIYALCSIMSKAMKDITNRLEKLEGIK